MRLWCYTRQKNYFFQKDHRKCTAPQTLARKLASLVMQLTTDWVLTTFRKSLHGARCDVVLWFLRDFGKKQRFENMM